MITFISFILVIAGAVNWFSIGALQYDFIAGLFGSQASMFSRIIYFFVGIAGIWLIIQAFRGKGRIKINDDGFERKKKKDVLSEERAYKTEAGREYAHRDDFSRDRREYSRHYEEPNVIEPRDRVNYQELGYKDFNEQDLDN